jgi:hypothetical protein
MKCEHPYQGINPYDHICLDCGHVFRKFKPRTPCLDFLRYIGKRVAGVLLYPLHTVKLLAVLVKPFAKGRCLVFSNVEIQVGDIVLAVNKEDTCKYRVGKVVAVTEKRVDLQSSHKDEARTWELKKNYLYVLDSGSGKIA